MNKQTLIWTLIVAVPVAVAALVAGYFFTGKSGLPLQEPSQTVSTGTPSTDGPQVQTETASGASSQEAGTGTRTAGEETGSDAQLKGPSFDVVGVEPTGETVVAGRSAAGAIVALVANGEVVGKSIANEAGEWTIILDEPLKPGDYDVGLQVHDEKGEVIEQSGQHLAVSVPADGKEQPLVVLNTPDGPSDILQKPATGDQVAQTGAASAGQETQVAAAGTADKTGSAQETAPVAEANGTLSAGAQQTGTQTATSETAAETPAPTVTALATGGAQDSSSGKSAEQVSSAAPAEGAQTGEATAGNTGATVTVEAVESEPNKVFVAGTGEPGSSVRVYVGDDYQGEAKVNSSGKWLVEGDKSLSEGNVEVRADLIGQDGNTVDARAAVTFEKEQDQQIVLTRVVASGASGGQDGQGAEVRKSLPVVIIRKGDNLWRISRRLYGDGVRYTTIYQANQDQIRNPDLIYPGQVFLTPEGDLNWKTPAGTDGRNG